MAHKSLKYLLSGPLGEKFAELCSRMRIWNGEYERKGDFKTQTRTCSHLAELANDELVRE